MFYIWSDTFLIILIIQVLGSIMNRSDEEVYFIEFWKLFN